MDPSGSDSASDVWKSSLMLVAFVKRDKLLDAVLASISTSWDSHADIPVTRESLPLGKSSLVYSYYKPVFVQNVSEASDFFACFLVGLETALVVDSCKRILAQLVVEKSTMDCPKRPWRKSYKMYENVLLRLNRLKMSSSTISFWIFSIF